jgi:hypothetical protein
MRIRKFVWAIVNNRGDLVKENLSGMQEPPSFLMYPQKGIAESQHDPEVGERVVKIYLSLEED